MLWQYTILDMKNYDESTDKHSQVCTDRNLLTYNHVYVFMWAYIMNCIIILGRSELQKV